MTTRLASLHVRRSLRDAASSCLVGSRTAAHLNLGMPFGFALGLSRGFLMRASLGLIMRLVAANAFAFAVLDCFAIGLRLLGRRARAERCWTVVGRGKKKRIILHV